MPNRAIQDIQTQPGRYSDQRGDCQITSRCARLNIESNNPPVGRGDGPVLQDWNDVNAWRRNQRAHLLDRRKDLTSRERRQASRRIVDTLHDQVPSLVEARLGFYWPINGEIDLRPLIRNLLSKGAQAALPVIVNKNQPLEFWQWDPQTKLCNRGLWGIPTPVERRLVQPTILLVPLLGFDGRGYRLGYGSGYYDRTLAAALQRPLTIGIGHEFGRLHTIHPRPHDVPMDAIITDIGATWVAARP